MPQKPEDRNYRAEYDRYHGTPQQKKNRAARNTARATMKKAGADIAGKDVDHKTALINGGGNGKKNLRVKTIAANRGFKRDRNNKPI